MGFKYDFEGWATRNDLLCSDGRTIRRDAFKEQDGMIVPMVWNHDHNSADNVLGHALLKNHPEGVRVYGAFNDTPQGINAKQLVHHEDIKALSIWANKLVQKGGDVLHGVIKEVSLVLAGANPGAYIDAVISHGDDGAVEEAIIFSGEELVITHGELTETETPEKETEEVVEHADDSEETVEDVFNTLTEKQKNVVYAIIAQVTSGEGGNEEKVEHADDGEETVEDVFNTLTDKQKDVVYAIIGSIMDKENVQHNEYDEGEFKMKTNVFDQSAEDKENVLAQSEVDEIFKDMKRYGSLKESFIQHGIDIDSMNVLSHADGDYGITNIDYLFPEARNVNNVPDFIKRNDEWVAKVMAGVHHSPFSRIKSIHANITADEARAKGYVKGNLKIEEVFPLLKRSTTPATVYKKQKLDRDDIIDIVDFDVVAWIKGEMRGMLNEELARAYLIGDGRSTSDDDKIDETHIRPIWTDSEVYTTNVTVPVAISDTDEAKAKNFIKAVIKNRKYYKGSGSPTLFVTEDLLCDMLLIQDTNQHDLYPDVTALCRKLRVKEIIPVPVFDNQTRTVNTVVHTLGGILVNLADYTVGADKGGAVNMFDDFDIDYNQEKYLIETRCSAALTKPYSAMAIDFVPAA